MIKTPTPQLDALLEREPDFVDCIFAYLLTHVPDLHRHVQGDRLEQAKQAVREEFSGRRVYIPVRAPESNEQLAVDVLSLFNGRNASEVARELRISRATVYRLLKQGPRRKVSSLPSNETAQTLRSRNRTSS